MKALFFGLGGVGQRHLRNLKQLRPEARFAAIRHADRRFEIQPDLTADHAVDIVNKYSIELYPSLAKAMDFAPDLAVVATPSNTHSRLALDLVRHGIPVLLEKPISHDLAGFIELQREAEYRNVPVMIGYMLRFNPAVQRLKSFLNENAIGRLHSAHIVANTYMPAWHPYESYSELYAARKDLGGGVILTNVHLIDLMVWMFGKPQRLWCLGGALHKPALDVEDCVAALFDYVVDGSPFPVSLNMSFIQRPIENSITVRGANGALVWTLADNRIVFQPAEGESRVEFSAPDYAWNQMFIDEMAHFIGCLENGQIPEAVLQQSAPGHEVALVMKASLETGSAVLV